MNDPGDKRLMWDEQTKNEEDINNRISSISPFSHLSDGWSFISKHASFWPSQNVIKPDSIILLSPFSYLQKRKENQNQKFIDLCPNFFFTNPFKKVFCSTVIDRNRQNEVLNAIYPFLFEVNLKWYPQVLCKRFFRHAL